MLGTNKIVINKATVKAALEMYLNNDRLHNQKLTVSDAKIVGTYTEYFEIETDVFLKAEAETEAETEAKNG